VIVGARGRMGMALLRAVTESDDLALVAAVVRGDTPGLGADVGRFIGMPEVGVAFSDTIDPHRGAVVVDFSLAHATAANVTRCVELGLPLVLGTTGLDASARAAVEAAARTIPVVWAPNFSVGVTVLTRLAALAARVLGSGWDADIIELHHRHKLDAPSGTALRIGEAVAAARGHQLEQVIVHDRRDDEGPRAADSIGVVALRGGDSIGEHTLMFATEGERIELTHRARDRAIFAHGALRAARWLAGRDAGLYDMVDVLDLQRVT
jgi:4-hydroxy-tetrahydrodipicolinate reductase